MDEKKNKKFTDPDDPFDDISEILENILNKMGLDLNDLANKSCIYGFSVSHRPGDDPQIREFGQVPPDGTDFMEGHLDINERIPLIDVEEIDDHVYVTAEIPAAEKDDIVLDAFDKSLEIIATNDHINYSEYVGLPVKVDIDSAKANFRNGVLEVIFRKANSEKRSNIIIDD